MNIIIPEEKREHLKHFITQNVDTKKDTKVSFYFDRAEKTLTLISGTDPYYSSQTLALPLSQIPRTHTQFSLQGSFCRELFSYSPETYANGDITLIFNSIDKKRCYIEIHDHSLSQDNDNAPSLRRCESDEIEAKHIEYLEKNAQRPTITVSKTNLEKVINVADEQKPFEYIEINNQENQLTIQRNEEIETRALPYAIPLHEPMVLTEAITSTLSHLCEQTKEEEIKISLQSDTVTFITNEGASTCSLSGIDEFYLKKPKKTVPILSYLTNILDFKKEIEHCTTKYKEIKKSDKMLLYIDTKKQQFCVCVLVGHLKFTHPIPVTQLAQRKGHKEYEKFLFSFSPKEVAKMKIRDLTTMKNQKMEIIKNAQDMYELGIYTTEQNQLPNHSLLLERSDDSKAIDTIETLMAHAMENESAQPIREHQQDLFALLEP